jgi:hypothetical protein
MQDSKGGKFCAIAGQRLSPLARACKWPDVLGHTHSILEGADVLLTKVHDLETLLFGTGVGCTPTEGQYGVLVHPSINRIADIHFIDNNVVRRNILFAEKWLPGNLPTGEFYALPCNCAGQQTRRDYQCIFLHTLQSYGLPLHSFNGTF